MTVQNIVWTVFEKFEIFMKRSGEKKRHDWISSGKFFPTPKNEMTKRSQITNMKFPKFFSFLGA